MSNAKQERKVLVANLNKVSGWGEAKLGSTSLEDLLWLAEVASLLPSQGRGMSETLLRYRAKYQPTICYSGRKSLNNGDAVAEFLAGLSPTETLRHAERLLDLDDGELTRRYVTDRPDGKSPLNEGQQRMNGGNMIRAAIKRGDITADELH